MANTVIKIEGKAYPIKFGYGAFRLMGKQWGCKGINDTMARLSTLDGIDENLTFEQEDIIADMIIAGISCGNPDAVELPSQNQVLEAVLLHPEVLAEVTTNLMASFPTRGNVQPANKAGKQKKK